MDTENIIDNNDNVNENVVEEQYMYNMDTENTIDNNDNVNENVVEEQMMENCGMESLSRLVIDYKLNQNTYICLT